ncbi:unnamed protein product [Heligmosomoides polygyrus]|uniref:TIL domain-containing protein n=1 Tax=Heligmosomoides polygyrus TaxID=6339 RepID=A0A183GN15_HELPZ|nr:unnamed protein product [Heligmosomoides polygyrus]
MSSSVSLTNWPSDPFTKVVSSRRPEVQLSSESESEEEMTSEEEAREREQAFMEKMRRRIPCTPDCDKRLYPHCTDECKCDYSYPFVQRFCNPPPLPLFLNVCRLWYWGCPKYAQYHYASQYIYSKAEKGKKLEGPQITNPNPYNIPSPAGVPHIGVPPTRAAGRPNRYHFFEFFVVLLCFKLVL